MTSEHLDLANIETSLTPEGLKPVGEIEWLNASYAEPEVFWQQLILTQGPLFLWPAKSIPFRKYDFFHDTVTRNMHNQAPALRWYEPYNGWHEISYSQLGDLAAARADVWSRAGVMPGHKVCIVAPMGAFATVSLLAALKLGAEVTLLPPQGVSFVRRRLTNLEPEWIAAEELNDVMVSNWREILLPDAADGGVVASHADRSWSYPSGTTVMRCFDPASRTPDIPCELSSDAAYLYPLRDGFLALGLRPGYAFAAPGSHYLETQPASLLACLLNGATYVHIPLEELEKRPDLLREHPLWSVQVSLHAAEILLREPSDLNGAWFSWFRNPAESRDLQFWREWVEALNLGKTPAGNLLWQAARGGCILFSIRRTGSAHLNALPSPGVPWQLAGFDDTSTDRVLSSGLFAPANPGQDEEEPAPTDIILARNRKEWLFAGMLTAGRAGRFYPKEEVLEALAETPFAECTSVVVIPASGIETHPSFALAVFAAGMEHLNKAHITALMRASIERALGREFLPDHITIFPLCPRKAEGGTPDHQWCQDQYLRGSLFRKARDPLYLDISQLRARSRGTCRSPEAA